MSLGNVPRVSPSGPSLFCVSLSGVDARLGFGDAVQPGGCIFRLTYHEDLRAKCRPRHAGKSTLPRALSCLGLPSQVRDVHYKYESGDDLRQSA